MVDPLVTGWENAIMKKAYKHVPQSLQGKVIAITGTGPGTGKSYSKNYMLTSFKELGFKVTGLGSMNRSALNVLGKGKTIHSYASWTDKSKCIEEKKYIRVDDRLVPIYPQKSEFIFIDEAMMLCQDDIDLVRKQFPKCCIFVIGDSNQMVPVGEESEPEEIYTDELGINHIVPGQNIERIKTTPIYFVDYCFELNKNYRQDEKEGIELRKVLTNIKGGIIAPNDLLRFFKTHQPTWAEDFVVCRTNKAIYSYEGGGIKGIYRACMNTGVVSNGQLFDKNGINLDEPDQKINIIANQFYTNKKGTTKESIKLVPGITCHKAQGATFKTVNKVMIDVDDALSIVKDVDTDNKQIEDFLRFLYVALSRFCRDDQVTIRFSENNVEKLLRIAHICHKLNSRIDPNETLSSKDFCKKVSPQYLESLFTKATQAEVYTNSTKLAYIYNNNNNIIYANLPENEYTSRKTSSYDLVTAAKLCYEAGYDRGNKWGIRRFLVSLGYNPKKVTGMLEEIFKYIDSFEITEARKKEVATGNTIGCKEEKILTLKTLLQNKEWQEWFSIKKNKKYHVEEMLAIWAPRLGYEKWIWK